MPRQVNKRHLEVDMIISIKDWASVYIWYKAQHCTCLVFLTILFILTLIQLKTSA